MAAVQDKEQIRKTQRQWLKTRDRNRELEAIITHQRTLGRTGDAVQYRYDENTHKITAVEFLQRMSGTTVKSTSSPG